MANIRLYKIAAVLAGVTILFSSVGCVRTGDAQTDNRNVELGAARAVNMHIVMGSGELALGGSTNELLKANFTYNVERWKPQVTYSITDGEGDLTVEQPSNDVVPIVQGDILYDWNLQVNKSVPLNMDITMGAGKSTLDLTGMSIKTLTAKLGAGETLLDLRGGRTSDLSGTVEAGAGRTVVMLPKEVGTHVVVHNGLGSVSADGLTKKDGAYVNDNYGKAGPAVDITIDAGAGDVVLTTSARGLTDEK